MKKLLISLILITVGLVVGVFIEMQLDVSKRLKKSDMDMEHDDSVTKTDEQKVLYWVAPMDPTYRRDEPGKSPMGMELVPVYEDGNEQENTRTVKINPKVVNNLGVRTAIVKRETLWKRISTVGYIDYDETRIHHIHTRTEGWIERLKVRAEGEPVKKGQLLFELYSPPLVNAQEEYLQAIASGNKRLVEASKQKLSALGISNSQINKLKNNNKITQNIRFYAPQSGIVKKLGVREGMYIKPETEVISIANLDSIWLLAEVFERQAGWVKEGQIAEAKIPSMPGTVWKGVVDYVYPDLDPVTRTLRVRLRFDNPEESLMPNMYAHIVILSGEKNDVLSIPREAVIRGSDHDRVIVSLGDGEYKAQEVITGFESGEVIEIISGVREDEKVVTSAQFLIDSESNLKASLNRIEPVNDSSETSSGMHEE